MNYDSSIRYIRNGAQIAEREAETVEREVNGQMVNFPTGKYLPNIINVMDCGSFSKAKRKSRELQGPIANGRPTHQLRCGKF